MQASQLGENYQRKLSSTEKKMLELEAELVSFKVRSKKSKATVASSKELVKPAVKLKASASKTQSLFPFKINSKTSFTSTKVQILRVCQRRLQLLIGRMPELYY